MTRPEPSPDAGINTLRLEVAHSREELAQTLVALHAKFNVPLLLREDRGKVVLLACAALVFVGAIVRRRTRGDRRIRNAGTRDV